jgi:hypothetical protein
MPRLFTAGRFFDTKRPSELLLALAFGAVAAGVALLIAEALL